MVKNYGIPMAEPKIFQNTIGKSQSTLIKKNNEFKIIKTERYQNISRKRNG